MVRSVSRSVFASIFSGLIALSASFGQTTTTPVTTPAPAPSLTSFSVESIIPLTNIDSVTQASIPADVLSALQGGTLEIRQAVSYTSASSTLTVHGFLVQPGSPIPTPTGTTGLTDVWNYTVAVSNVTLSSKTMNSVILTGTINPNDVTPFGDISGTVVSFSTGYTVPTDGSAPTFTGVSTSVVGVATLFAKAGAGTITSGSSGGGSAALTAVAGPKNAIMTLDTFQLDGTQSTGNGKLTFQWTFVPQFGQSATLSGANTATPTVTLPDYAAAFGNYTFQLMVTDSTGATNTATVVLLYDPASAEAQPPQ
jgi:hypothetical protein